MLKANELRIGNYIQDFEDKPYYFKVESIENKDGEFWVSYRNGSINCSIEHIEPIPLTEEWLVKFGFEKIKNTEVFLFGGYWEVYYNPDYERYLLDLINIEIKVESVHQLQNIHFAFTGEELVCK